jgi:hypothetical protein
MIADCDCTDPQQVFNRLAQLQHETKKRLDRIDTLMHDQHKSDEEFSKLEKVARAYLLPLDFPAVNARAYEFDLPSIGIDHTILMDEVETIVRPTANAFSIHSLTQNEVDALLKSDGATESAFETAIEKALDELESGREYPPDNTNMSAGA